MLQINRLIRFGMIVKFLKNLEILENMRDSVEVVTTWTSVEVVEHVHTTIIKVTTCRKIHGVMVGG
jgi:hypothetical protein